MVAQILGYSGSSGHTNTNTVTSGDILLFHMANASCLAGIYVLSLCKTRTSETMNHPKNARKLMKTCNINLHIFYH